MRYVPVATRPHRGSRSSSGVGTMRRRTADPRDARGGRGRCEREDRPVPSGGGGTRDAAAAPQPALAASVPHGGGANAVHVREWGDAPTFAFAPRPHWELAERPRASWTSRRGEGRGQRVSAVRGARRTLAAAPDLLHHRPAYPRSRLHGGLAAVSGQRAGGARHGSATQVRRRHVLRPGGRALPDPDGGSTGHESARGRILQGGGAPDPVRGL